MKVTVTTEHRFCRTPDGAVWTCAQYAYSFFLRYLEVFDEVEVLSRVLNVEAVPEEWKRADGPRVRFEPLPHYLGPMQYFQCRGKIAQILKRTARGVQAVILRAASPTSSSMGRILERQGRPFGVEVIGDPWEFFTPGAVRHPLRPFIRVWSYRQLARLCRSAHGVAYVTREALQQRYPASPGALVASYSDVELSDAAYRSESRRAPEANEPVRLVSVGTLAQLYKAQDVLITAVSRCVAQGKNIQLVLVGDGQFRAQLEAQARILGVGDRIRFAGELPSGEAIRAELDRADMFVLPSRSEGLPRALIEAMARGLPCIGSTVGGIPELLHPEDLVPPNDARALSELISCCLEEPGRLSRMSERNLGRARDYHESALREARVAFYRSILGKTEQSRRRASSCGGRGERHGSSLSSPTGEGGE